MSVTHLHRAATRPQLPARDYPPGDAPAVAYVPLSRLRAHPRNMRRDLGDLRELIDSIRSQGVLQPLRAERRPGADFLRIRAGHRRAAAAQLAGETRCRA